MEADHRPIVREKRNMRRRRKHEFVDYRSSARRFINNHLREAKGTAPIVPGGGKGIT